MSKLVKIKNVLAKEPRGYHIKNPFTKYYFDDVIQYYRSEVSALYTKSLTLLSVVVALSAAPVYMIYDLLDGTPSLFEVVPFICLIISLGYVFYHFLKVIDHSRGKAISIEVPSNESLTVDYEEKHENELWYLEVMRRVSNETRHLYNKLIAEYIYSLEELKKTLIFLGGIVIYFMLLKVVCVL